MTERFERLQAHVDGLCRQHGIEADYRQRTRPVSWRRPRRIRVMPVTTQWRYAIALHEIGHIVGPRRSGARMEQEMGAWEWAIGESREPFTPSTYRRIVRCLTGYLRWAGRHRRAKVPAEGGSFWTMFRAIEERADCS